ncbi:MAG: hypothetical protein U1C57_01725, partial [Candidatus Doudnabacteria bacterium]|nr:hypothetical protein [Candidatus Doudnabacteria bacterium]
MIGRLKNYYYRIAKSRATKTAAAVFLVILVAGAVGVFLARGKFADPGTRAQFLREHPGVTKILPLYWKIRKITDVTYLSYFFKKDEVPNYELVIAENDLKKLNDSLPKGFMNVVYTDKVFAPAEFRAGDKTYQVRVRYRGINAVHWNARKRSYLI